MKTILERETFGIVLDRDSVPAGSKQGTLSAHVILSRCPIDDDGNICLSASAGFLDILDTIDLLKSELDSLANETVLWFAQNIAIRRARIAIASNDELETALGGDKGGGGCDSGSTSPPRPTGTLYMFHKLRR
jgi:hypothetical protein